MAGKYIEPIALNLHLENMEAVARILEDVANKEIQKAMRRAVTRGARYVLRDAKARAPVLTGKLKKSIKLSTKGLVWRQRKLGITTVKIRAGWPTAEHKPGEYYAQVIEYGSSKRNIPPRPFLHPAIEAKRHMVQEEIAKELNKMCREVQRKI